MPPMFEWFVLNGESNLTLFIKAGVVSKNSLRDVDSVLVSFCPLRPTSPEKA